MPMIALPMIDPVYAEWNNFLKTGNPYNCKARKRIVESWDRCYHVGVNPYDEKIHNSLDEANLKKVLKEKETLIQIAKPFMSKLYNFFQGNGVIVVLTDENSCILEMLCDEDTWHNPLIRYFYPGVSWREEEVGTNAIGTALKLREPLHVAGAEHYCKKIHCFDCSASTIFDVSGRAIGVLDMSYPSQTSSASLQHTLGMVVAIAEAITAQVSIRQKNDELMSLQRHMTNCLNSISDVVIIVDTKEVVIEINTAGKALLGKSEQTILGTKLKCLFDSRSAEILTNCERYQDIEILLDTKNGGCYCVVSREPIMNEHETLTGSTIIIKLIKQVQNTATRFGGHSATLQFGDIIGESVKIREAMRIATRAAATTSNILLNGESGTGKEIFAQAIHNRSTKQSGPFVAVNCGAIPRELIGSELFGYDEGAFTGAKRGGKAGKFELASGGTLFLDEIGDMPLEQQTALLRVIQERKVARIGSDKMIPINIRLICATHKNLLQEVEKGNFRLDLFYRLHVLTIMIPPLRDHLEDIPLLVEYFIGNLSREQGCKFSVEHELIEYLQRYHWPGNIRELQNVIEHATSLAENGVITVDHLPELLYAPSIPQAMPVPQIDDKMLRNREQRQEIARHTEKDSIVSKLNAFAGNVSRVAKELGISRKTLYNKMRLHAIDN